MMLAFFMDALSVPWDATNIAALAHCDAVRRGHPLHQRARLLSPDGGVVFSGKSTRERLFPSAWALRWAVERPIAHLFSRLPTTKVVALPHATAIKSRCRAATVAIRVEPGHQRSLFMGRRTLAGTWRDVAEWLKEDDAGRPVGPIRVGCSTQ
jgi:hypothetical protein